MRVVECRAVTVSFGDVIALRSVDLAVGPGESVALLGPSGSGKSTLLHALAGFVDIDEGHIRLAGETVSTPGATAAPDRRSVGFVFQNYALWPHLTALETVAYPMRRSGAGRRDAEDAALTLLEAVGIGELGHRRPAELSGGEQQRVGLARALAREARLYLFDEPTAHLDAALRASIHEEIARRRRGNGAAAVYATHDAGEALAVADRVAVLRAGGIVQVGTPTEVYEQPVDLWVAELTGRVSMLSGIALASSEAGVTVDLGPVRVLASGTAAPGSHVDVLVRPEWVEIGAAGAERSLPAEVAERWFRGPHSDYRLATAIGTLDCRLPGPPRLAVGDGVGCVIRRAWVAQA